MQRAGGRYRAANGSRLPNLGQQVAAFRTSEGLSRSLRFQLAGVERPLISVAQLARTGHRVEFGADAGHIVHVPSGQRLRLQRAGGVHLLRMLVKDARGPGAGSVPREGNDLARLEGPTQRRSERYDKKRLESAGSASGLSRPRN